MSEARPPREHVDAEGLFQSDKYPWCHPGFVPLKLTDQSAWPMLWQYAEARAAVDEAFADDLKHCLRVAGYSPPSLDALSDPAPDDTPGRLIRHPCDECRGECGGHGVAIGRDE